ncbi:MAG: hypothetical protein KatS3mg019_0016 [Fimbriimonadales bacterium]|nr:MAG: hypothetical protein KatS3mg019_0016 [Fimbriimonadales bacterium]
MHKMNRCHVFVVNEKTFPYHLKYRFAGTTAGENRAKHVGLLADIARTRPGDKVLFYLQKKGFFGVYEVDSDHPFVEPTDGWLQTELGIPLIYRIRIRPAEIYSRPLSEWKAVDELPERARDIRWSLIYRKLKGERGCSYLFPQEWKNIYELIKFENENRCINVEENELLIYECKQNLVITKPEVSPSYEGSSESAHKHLVPVVKESHLQAWLTWHIGRNVKLEAMIPSQNLVWFANEVYAGAGMQKMDILCIWDNGSAKEYGIFELKGGSIGNNEISSMIEQTRRYIWWVDNYIREQSDTVRVVWIVRELAGKASEAKKLLQEEQDKGVRSVEIWVWKLGQDKEPSFRKEESYPSSS